MLDERITQFVHEAMRIKAREFDHELALRLRDIDSRAALAGATNGSARGNQYAQACCQDLGARAQYLFSELQRALALHPQLLTDTIRNFLVGLHITEVRGQCTELQNLLEKRFRNAGAFGANPTGTLCTHLNDECAHLREKFTLEIGAFVQSQAQRESLSAAGPSGFVFHGPVGVVQTGPYSSATLTGNIGDSDKAALLRALDLVETTMLSSRQVDAEQRRQLLEVIENLKSASQETRPNTSLMKGLFSVLCQTLQTLASADGAMAAIRTAALPFGITI